MGEITAKEWQQLRVKRWTTTEALRVLAVLQGSGLSVAAFCRRHGLKEQRVGWWKTRAAEWREISRPSSAPEKVTFAPAIVRTEAPPSVGVTIRLAHGTVIEVTDPERVAPRWLVKVLAGLRR